MKNLIIAHKAISAVVAGLAVTAIALAVALSGHSAAWQHGYDFGYEVNSTDLQVYGDAGALSSQGAQKFCSETVADGSSPFDGKYGEQAPPAAGSSGASDWVAGCVAAEVSNAGG